MPGPGDEMQDTHIETIPVELEKRRYRVLVGGGLVADAPAHLEAALPDASRWIVIADETVLARHGAELKAALAGLRAACAFYAVAPGEASKSPGAYSKLAEEILQDGLDRKAAVIAFGGGVTGDLAGFLAATLLRGIRFVQIPTTLLAQVDSSVGGKTGINTRAGKNLVGAFHQPSLVLADTDLLETLPAPELHAGYAEIVKAALIDSPAFFGWCEETGEEVVTINGPARRKAIARAIRLKAGIVARDEQETGERALLNLGHTLAHALETVSGHRVSHGAAVAVGLHFAFHLAEETGLGKQGLAARISTHLRGVGLPATIEELGLSPGHDAILAAMRHDKKAVQGRLRFVLPRNIGDCMLVDDIREDQVTAALGSFPGSGTGKQVP